MPTGIKISQLADDALLDGTEEVPLITEPVGPGSTKKATTGQIAALGQGTLEATLAGSVSGHAYVIKLAASTNYKAYRVVLDNWCDAGQTHNWGTPFTDFAAILNNAVPPASTSTTVLTLADNHTSSAISQIIEVAGK